MKRSIAFFIFLSYAFSHVLGQIADDNGTMFQIVINRNDVNKYRDKQLIAPLTGKLSMADVFFLFEEGSRYWGIGANNNLEFYIRKEDGHKGASCLYNSNGLTIKTTVVQQLGANNISNVNYYDKPQTNISSIGDLALYDTYFVWDFLPRHTPIDSLNKADYVLIGTSESLVTTSEYNEAMPQKVILGWVKANELLFWNTSIALEQNFEIAQEKLNNRKFAKIWANKRTAEIYFSGGIVNNPNKFLLYSDSADCSKILNGTKTPKPDNYRFPVLENKGNGILKIAFVGGLRGAALGLNALTHSISKEIEILFLLDATKTMKQYGAVLPNALANASKYISENYKSYQIKYGLAVFRNSLDQNNIDYPQYKYYGTTSSTDEFNDWLLPLGLNGFGSHSKKEQEDLFYGGCSMMDENDFKDENKGKRILFVITDIDGEERPPFKPSTFGRKLLAKRTDLIVLNVGRQNETLKRQVQGIAQTHNTNFNDFEEIGREQNYILYAQSSLGSNKFIDRYAQATVSGTIESYKNTITGILKDIIVINDIGTDNSETGRKIKVSTTYTFPEINNYYLDYLPFRADIGIYYFEGYTKYDNKDKLFRPVVLMKEKEIENLYRFMERFSKDMMRLNSASQQVEAREEILKELGNTRNVYLNTKSEIEAFTKDIPVYSQFITQMLRKDGGLITDNSDKSKWSSIFDVKSDKLRKIWISMTSDPENQCFQIGLERYRYVPYELFP
jgi:hypothetical protein